MLEPTNDMGEGAGEEREEGGGGIKSGGERDGEEEGRREGAKGRRGKEVRGERKKGERIVFLKNPNTGIGDLAQW